MQYLGTNSHVTVQWIQLRCSSVGRGQSVLESTTSGATASPPSSTSGETSGARSTYIREEEEGGDFGWGYSTHTAKGVNLREGVKGRRRRRPL